MNRLVVFTCGCHKGQVYLMDDYNRVIKRISILKGVDRWPIDGLMIESENGYPYKEVTNIKDLLINLTR